MPAKLPPKQSPSQPKKKPRRSRRKTRAAVERARARSRVVVVNRSRQTPAGMDQKLFQTLLDTLTLPHDTKPMRYPIPGVARKTAILKLCSELAVSLFPDAIGDLHQQAFLLTQSPTAPVWTNRTFPFGTIFSFYQYTVPANAARILGLTQVGYGTPYSPSVGWYEPLTSSTMCKYLHYVPAGMTMTFAATGWGSVTGNLLVSYYPMIRLSTAPPVPMSMVIPLTAGSGSNFVTLMFTSWILISEVSLTAGTWTAGAMLDITVSVSTNPVTALVPAFPTLELAGRQELLHECRVTSNSLLVTNTTPNMFRGGAMDGTIIDFGSTNIFDMSTLPSVIQSRNASLRYVGPGENGAYAYSLPSDRSQFMTNYICTDNPIIQSGTPYTPPCATLFRLEDFQFPTAILYSCTATANTIEYNGQNFQIFYDEHFEAVSTGQLFPLGVAPLWHTLDLQNKLYTAIADRVPVCENPGHWSKLKNIASKALSYMDNACAVAGMISSLAI